MNDRLLWAWINERHAIYIRKSLREGLTPDEMHVPEGVDLQLADPDGFALMEEGMPFTHDRTMRTYRFCNVFRELDRVTIWVRENIREPFADHPNLWIMLAIARYLNWPPTLKFLIDNGYWPDVEGWTPDLLSEGMDALVGSMPKRLNLPQKWHTGAYMIRAESNKSAPWYDWPKHQYLCKIVIGRLWEDRELWRGRLELADPSKLTLREVHSWFLEPRYIGWGHFMSYEVVTDLRHTRYLNQAPDIMTWANTGPGAKRGLNRIFDRPLKKNLGPVSSNEEMQQLLETSRTSEYVAPWVPPMEMRDIEHSLCEMDKWLRSAKNEGRPRALYVQGRHA